MFNIFKNFTLLLIAILMTSSVIYSQNDQNMDHKMDNSKGTVTDEPVGIKMSDGILYGKDYSTDMAIIEFADVIKGASDNNGKVVLIKGNVAEVCQAMGCWMTMSDGTIKARVKTGHEFLLPKDVAGRDAIVIGTFKITEISEDDARHYNEETKNPIVKTEDIIGIQKVYEIDAIGIKILNPVSEGSKN